MRLSRAGSEMRFRIVGRSRFTGDALELELRAATADEAVAKALRLGLADVDAKPVADGDPSTPRKAEGNRMDGKQADPRRASA